MEILKVLALLMLSYGLVSSQTPTTTADPTTAPTTAAPTAAPPGQASSKPAPVTNAPGPTGGSAGNNPTTTQAPPTTTADPFAPGQTALTALSSKCTAKTVNDNCNTEEGLVDTAIKAANHTALCSTFKTYFGCTKEKCEDTQDFKTSTDGADNFLSTHCSSAVLTQGSMALAITLAWLSAYISGKL